MAESVVYNYGNENKDSDSERSSNCNEFDKDKFIVASDRQLQLFRKLQDAER